MKNIYLIFGLVLSLANCEKANDDCYDPNGQIIIFEMEYINFAWGYDHQGWLLDNEGKVHFFNLPVNWNNLSDVFISEDSLIVNINNCDTTIYTVNKKELNKYTCFIKELSLSNITEPVHTGYDGGTETYYCFNYNKKSKTYKRILIKQYGDVKSENLSDKTDLVYNWLYKIDTLVRRMYYYP